MGKNINLKVLLKSHANVDSASEYIVQTIQQATTMATTYIQQHRTYFSLGLLSDIKQLIINKNQIQTR